MKVGLFFGSFNPIHIGHLIIANQMVEQTDLEQVWLVVSPQNPFKRSANLLDEYHRLDLVHLAVEDNDRLRPCDIEFNLPKPSYTIDTLVHLKEKYPDKDFSLIMGGDNLKGLHKWKNAEILMRDYKIYVYERAGYELDKDSFESGNIHFVDAPLMYISATFIRKIIKEGKSARYMLPDKVFRHIDEMNWYK